MKSGKTHTFLRAARPMVNRIDVRANDQLYAMILADAEELGCSLSEVLTRCFAKTKGNEKLGILEKGTPGRKPQAKLREAVA